MSLIGWEPILPQLVAFFTVLKRRRRVDDLTPCNLFISGGPGTSKTLGPEVLAQATNLSIAIQDASVIDDVAELAGVVNVQANRLHGRHELIEGELLTTDLLVLDELLNARAHVVPELRLFLQGRLVLFAKKVPMAILGVIATGNLQEDMSVGDANVFDSPTADRFAIVVKAISLADMPRPDSKAIVEDQESDTFVNSFTQAMEGVSQHLEAVKSECGGQATNYVLSLVGQLAKTPFAFEGRRAKLLRSFILVAMALCRAQPERQLKDVMWVIMRDCLTYHRLSGLTLDLAALEAAHNTAFEAMGGTSIEAMIASEPDLSQKVRILVDNLPRLAALTKADVIGQVVQSNDLPLQIAAYELVQSSIFAGQPPELAAVVMRIPFPRQPEGITLGRDHLVALASMTLGEVLAFEVSGGDQAKTAALTNQVRQHLVRWGVR